jgi:hypothetical protein
LNRLVITLFVLLALGCSDPGEVIKDIVWPADAKVMGMRIHCKPDCPEKEQIEDALLHMEQLWAPHLDFSPRDVWTRYAITFSDQDSYRADGVRILGMTYHGNGVHWIYQPHPCEGYARGLCPGVFDWELGLGLAHHVLGPDSTELQKLEWRQERGLINELAQEL